MENHTLSPKTLSVPEAGALYFGLARNAAYAAAARGEIPTIRIGGRIRVPVIALERMLLATCDTDENNPALNVQEIAPRGGALLNG